MKPLHVVYIAILALSLVLVWFFHSQYHWKNQEMLQYRNLSEINASALAAASAKLAKTGVELDKAVKELERLNLAIAVLEGENSGLKGQLAALKTERDAWAGKCLVLEQKFRSLDELKKAIKLARSERNEQRLQRHLAKIALLKERDALALRQGNRGFLVLAGESTFRMRTKINVEIEPLDKLSAKEKE